MNRTITATFAALGLIVSSAIGALLVAGLIEGVAAAPGWLPETAAIAFFVAGTGLTGRVCVDVADGHAMRAVVAVTVLIGSVGWLASRVTEAHGEGLEPTTLLIAMAGLAAMLIASVRRVHRRRRRT
jgi:hypothetical protein